MGGPFGKVGIEPLYKQSLQLVGKPNQRMVRDGRPRFAARREDILDFGIVDAGG